MTVLDVAYAAMLAGGDAEGMAFYRCLADAELFVVLEGEPVGEVLAPRVFELSEGVVLLAFDTEERLAGFSEGVVPYAALPGRIVAGQMVGQGLSLGLNLGSGAASEVILPPEALDWLMAMLDQAPAEQVEAQVVRFEAPVVPAEVLAALAGVLGGKAWLAGVEYQGGRRGVMLALAGVAEEAKMARAVTEALAFSGLEASVLDVVFVTEGDAVVARMEGVALMFDGEVVVEEVVERVGPGADPLRPPILR